MSFQNSSKMSIFRKGKGFLPNLIFIEKGLGMMYDDDLDRKKAF